MRFASNPLAVTAARWRSRTLNSAARAAGDWKIEDGTKLRHGHGTFVNGAAEGNTYEGEWSNDRMCGRGTFVYASKAKYEGEFVDNLYAGHGIYSFPDGAVYDGDR